ncbi:universal stress protein [Paraeggerthella hongkongensis]|uniref:Universal stress protein n=1 Tax=Paraeggerthella hongkongensis TaxID=230658 RepID=A0A3N0B756_9ACTN|nr:universal stress protein [Paraeggerthella hongkongensis]RNL42932.1 universal stress protein [Paraeggerthella hongkongensis]
MAVNNLLVAFDESEGGRRALDTAVSLAEVNPAVHIDIAYVVPIPLLDESQMASFKEILDMMISDGEDLLAEAVADVREDVAARIDSLLLTGTNPATEILKLVDQRDYDLVVVGNRGLSGLKEYLGSVSHKILHGSKIPVLVAK